MTALTDRQHETEENLRLLPGRRLKRPTMAPWMVVAVLAMVAFLGLGFARTSLDRSAFDMGQLNRAIAEQEALNLDLRLQIARLENPARIAPLAEELGLVIPQTTHRLMVNLEAPVSAGTERQRTNQ